MIFFVDNESFWVFVYGPIGLLLFTNLILFIYTTFKIIMLKRETEALHHDSSNKTNKKRQQRYRIIYRKINYGELGFYIILIFYYFRFILYLKIFFVMGVSWVTEVISWRFYHENSLRYVWYITDAINILRIIYLFKFLCCRQKVWIAIKKRVSCTEKLEQFCLKSCCEGKIQNDDFKTISTSISHSKKEPDHGKPDC